MIELRRGGTFPLALPLLPPSGNDPGFVGLKVIEVGSLPSVGVYFSFVETREAFRQRW